MCNRDTYPEFQNHTQALDLMSKMLFKSFLCIHRLDFSNAPSMLGEIDTNRDFRTIFCHANLGLFFFRILSSLAYLQFCLLSSTVHCFLLFWSHFRAVFVKLGFSFYFVCYLGLNLNSSIILKDLVTVLSFYN